MGNDMFFIKKGVVSVANKDGFHTTLQEGNFVGEMALVNNKPRVGTVTCLTPVEGVTIPREYFEKFLITTDTNVRMNMYRENKAREMSRIRMMLRQAGHLHTKKLRKGDVLFKQGGKDKALYIVIDGEISRSTGRLSLTRNHQGDIISVVTPSFRTPLVQFPLDVSRRNAAWWRLDQKILKKLMGLATL
ncbi:unnamed protein product [Cylindrotheca closterium]|nr:unnamed protein product [Cylindrotheca closterium]CAJ1965681.1 unnamed protein product [Cylindrotheca closterium]